MKYNFYTKIMVISPTKITIVIYLNLFLLRDHQFLPATVSTASLEKKVSATELLFRLFWSNLSESLGG